MRRRHWLAVTGAAALTSACASLADAPDRLLDVASGREISRADLLARLRKAQHVLLGERHDNPHHHARRGALIAELGPGAVVVAEQLPRGARVNDGADLLARLVAAGFEPRSWQWPQHRALFAAVVHAGLPLHGGNAPRDLVRQTAREGPSAWPADLRRVIEAAPLDAAARDALDQDLVAGHCGQLPAARVPAMRAAQRTRDASMALALVAAGGRPSVLVAGNGHVRLDHGVPQLLRAMAPQALLVSVGFGEPGTDATAAPYDVLWITPGVERADPCAGFHMPPMRPPA